MKIWVFIFCLALSGCDQSSKDQEVKVSTSKVIDIRMSAPVDKSLANSPVKFNDDCLPQADFCFHKFRRSHSAADLPTVVVDGTFRVPHVVSFMIAEDKPLSKNIENLDLTIRSLPSNSRHEEYRKFIYDLIEKLQNAGWHHYYMHYLPRISGAEFASVASSDKVFNKSITSDIRYDPHYKMTIEEWNQTNGFYNWNFYKDGIYLSLDAWRNNSIKAPKERGTYLVSLEFKTESTYWRHSFSKEADQQRWKELLPGLLADYSQQRKALEDKARAAGIKIDTSYQDPPIKALQARQLTSFQPMSIFAALIHQKVLAFP